MSYQIIDSRATRFKIRDWAVLLAGLFVGLSALSYSGVASAASDAPQIAQAPAVCPPVDPDIRFDTALEPGALEALLRWTPGAPKLVSAHRGGPEAGFPENAIETLDNALKYGPSLLEVDVAQLGDGTLVLMHDNTLDRTTTGQGPLKDANWDAVRTLFLRDAGGTVTPYRVPKLSDALNWAKGRAILSLDLKPGLDLDRLATLLSQADAADFAFVIPRTLGQARVLNQRLPALMFSLRAGTAEDIQTLKASGLDTTRVIAWTGLRLAPKSHYQALHRQGWMVTMGTLGFDDQSFDAIIAREGKPSDYLDLYDRGVDIIATDRPTIVHCALRLSGYSGGRVAADAVSPAGAASP